MRSSHEVVLRAWRPEDASTLARLANNAAIAGFMTDAFPYPYSKAHANSFIAFATAQVPARIFAIEAQGDLAGGIGLHPQQDISRKNAELGYWIAEPFWGRGIATAAVKQITAVGFSLPDVERIFARPFGENIASQRVLQKCGFVLEAVIRDGFYKNGRYCDEHIYALRKVRP